MKSKIGITLRSGLVIILILAWYIPTQTIFASPLSEDLAAAVSIDATISLYANPLKPEEREPYERVIGYFADGVFESSNGAHKIRNVTIYTRGRNANKADVVWVQSCWPSGAISGRANTGLHVNFCDKFGTYDFLGSETTGKGGGYTLAHEWGHYFYSMYDEYQGNTSYDDKFTFPHSDDTPVQGSIMNSQFNAVNGDYKWLNFSTDLNFATKTAQGRVYGASAWTTLTRPVSDDPRDGERKATPTRLYYSEMAAVAPQKDESPKIDLPNTDARSELKIIWMSDNIAYQIVIDNSGSMADEGKMTSAILAANLLVDLAEPEITSIGVIQFDDNVFTVLPLTLIVDQSTKASIKAVINGIYPDGYTAIGDGAAAALPALQAIDPSIGNRAVFLLTDGLNNSGRDPESVIPEYIASNIPLYTFAYGSDADPYLLQSMASQTGGKFYYSPTSLATLSQVFQDANKSISPSSGIAAGKSNIAQGAPSQNPFIVDATIERLDIVLTYPGTPEFASIYVADPSGTSYPPSCSGSAYETLCLISVDNPQPGQWILHSTSNSGSIDLDYQINGSTQNAAGYSATITSIDGDFIEYPEPIVLMAVLSKELPIQGVQASAQAEGPDGSVRTFEMRDDGIAPDNIANDGLFSAIIDYNMDGTYNISVQFTSTGNAFMTDLAYAPSIDPDGNSKSGVTQIPVNDTFTRFARTQVTVSNVYYDDHGNEPSSATYLSLDNLNLSGKIDYPDDTDAFLINANQDGVYSLRISDLALGMSPTLKLLKSDGTTIIQETDLSKSSNYKGYLLVDINLSAGDTIYAIVSSTSGSGTYRISAGVTLSGEKAGPSGTSSPIPWWIILIGAGLIFAIIAIILLSRKPKLAPGAYTPPYPPAMYPPAYPPQNYPPAPQPYQPPAPSPQPYYPPAPAYPPQPQLPPQQYQPIPQAPILSYPAPIQPSQQPIIEPAGQFIGFGAAANIVFNLSDGLTIGRNPTCSIRLTDPTVSRQHAQIRLVQNRWHIQDLGSSHGTYINGVRITFAALNPGDRVKVGNTEFIFQ